MAYLPLIIPLRVFFNLCGLSSRTRSAERGISPIGAQAQAVTSHLTGALVSGHISAYLADEVVQYIQNAELKF